MALKITCPHCRHPRRLRSPFPLPGAELHCRNCGRVLSITYPPGMIEKLRGRGATFVEQVPPTPATAQPAPAPPRRPDPLPIQKSPLPSANSGAETAIFRKKPAEQKRSAQDRTAPRVPNPPPTARRFGQTISPAAEMKPTPQRRPGGRSTGGQSSGRGAVGRGGGGRDGGGRGGGGRVPPRGPSKPAPPRKKRSIVRRLFRAAMVLTLLGGVTGAGLFAYVWWYYSQDLPTVETLRDYTPPTVTVIYDRKGKLLGEIYEKRRYVLPKHQLFPKGAVTDRDVEGCTQECLADDGVERAVQCDCSVPSHVKDVFIAAEDANFWDHGGVDYEGIVRAIVR
ncbi:MAG: transglycosylase domain-containing protein, partial [Myxococcota bacterium]